ncbi:MAG: hypothetical protein AAGA55_06840, partial [Planctomycetota bacterium]
MSRRWNIAALVVLGTILALFVVLYFVLVVDPSWGGRFPNSKTFVPDETVTGPRWNPIGGFNARFEGIPEEQLAWPLIVEVDAGINQPAFSEGRGVDWDSRPGDSSWDNAVLALDHPESQQLMTRLDRLESIELLGVALRDGDDPIEARFWNDGLIDDPSTARPPSISVLLHAVTPIDRLVRMLHAEARRAIEVGDANRWESARLRELE